MDGVRKRRQWSPRAEARFLDTLSATCQVQKSAEAAGLPIATVYYRRRRNAQFAAAWSDALAQGYEVLETHLVAMAISGEQSVPTGLSGALARIERDHALRLLAAHRQDGPRRPRRGGPARRRLTPEEIEAALTAKIDAVVKAQRTSRP